MATIAKTLECISDVQKIAVSAAKAVKALQAGGLANYLTIIGCMASAAAGTSELLKDAPEALPELKDLDMEEVGQLGAAAYGVVTEILAVLKA